MSSKASRLGTSASFGNARPVSARRAAINSATKAPTEGAPPPVVLPVRNISLNPANPRATLGDLSALAGSLKDHGQKQAITLMARDSYLAANPGQHENLEPDTSYVVIDGNSRLAAAREAGLPTIKVMVDDELGSDPDELLESALVANIHRQALAPLDEARALQSLLAVHGSQRKLASRLHRSQGWVAQRLALLGLTPELQQRLERKEVPVELLRAVGNKPPEEQEAEFERLKQAKADEESAKEAYRLTASGPRSDYAVITPPPSQDPAATGSSDYAVITSPSEPAPAPASARPPAGDYAVITPASTSSSAPAPVRAGDDAVITQAPDPHLASASDPAGQDLTSAPPARPADDPQSDYAVITSTPSRTSRRPESRAPEPSARAAAHERTTAEAMPWEDPKAVLAIAKQWMTPENYRTLLKLADEASA
ncbi:ParB/RepB/Spo0J family partition protein [Streptomyces sp. NPDC058657]|uniref:ParB/RepB/Spo0J family partition protein n=1 Tax=unclassified Streptomyces TaxID=2593676 RepID=UPI00364BD6D5